MKHLAKPVLAILLSAAPLHAAEILDPTLEKVEKIEVTASMIGFRDTLRFYVFEKQKAVLVVRIGNEGISFPISAKLHVFGKNADAEGLGKWVNNQHSDGLFPEVPEPEASHEIPAASCTVKSHEAVGQVDGPNGKFTRHSVTFSIKDVPGFGEKKLKDFTGKATVFVKSEEA